MSPGPSLPSILKSLIRSFAEHFGSVSSDVNHCANFREQTLQFTMDSHLSGLPRVVLVKKEYTYFIFYQNFFYILL